MLSDVTGDATDAGRDVVPDETNGEADAREFNGKTDSVPPGDKADWGWKSPSSAFRTDASPNEIYLLGKILESLGSMS